MSRSFISHALFDRLAFPFTCLLSDILYFGSILGASIVANIYEHMVKSRKVIVVLSIHYFNGMNEFELDVATTLLHDHDIEDIIVIKLGDLPARRIPNHLYRQMRNDMFIEWEDDENAKEAFLGKLIDRLQRRPEYDDA